MNFIQAELSIITYKRGEEMKTIVNENIGKLMTIRNISQKKLAQNTNLSRNTINKHTSLVKVSNPTLSTLMKISFVLDIDFPQLFSENINYETTFDDDMNLDEYMNIFIQNLEYQLRGKKQKSISYELGISESTISEILNGKILNPKLSTVLSIAEKLEIKIEYMFKRGAGK